MEVANYKRQGNTLRIWGSLDWPLEVQFDIETRALLDEAQAQGHTNVVIDLLGLSYMGSQYIGALAAVAAEMKKSDGGLAVRAKGRVAELLRACGLDRVVSLEIE